MRGVLRVALEGEEITEAEAERRVLVYVDQRREQRDRIRDYSRPLDRLAWIFDRPELPPPT